jgi:hypothetical protein
VLDRLLIELGAGQQFADVHGEEIAGLLAEASSPGYRC